MAKPRKRPEPASGPAQERISSPENGNRDRIAARAYELYLARGGAHGADWEDWLAAEREFANASESDRAEE